MENIRKFAYRKPFLDFIYNKINAGKNNTKIKPSNLKPLERELRPTQKSLILKVVNCSILKIGITDRKNDENYWENGIKK